MGSVAHFVAVTIFCVLLVNRFVLAEHDNVKGVKDDKHLFFHHPHLFRGGGLGHGIYKKGFRQVGS